MIAPRALKTLLPVTALCLGLMIAAPGPAPAQIAVFDRSTPINVDAGSLEVRQEDGRAIFQDKVVVVQGDFRLTTDKLIVHYGTGAAGSTSTVSDISKLEATGNVVITSPAEQGKGDWAIYDLATRNVRLGGDVVLTRDANVLKGRLLTIDLNTGISRLEADEQPSTEGGGGRVSAVFVPPTSDKQDKPKKTPEEKAAKKAKKQQEQEGGAE